MDVFVLGHRGMLGHVVAALLRQNGHDVVTCSERYSGEPRDRLIEAVRDSRCEWVINCIGRIKQKDSGLEELLRANAQLPLHLATRLRDGQRLIHASTDCVFSGRRGGYRVDDERDAEDAYGFSKILGECAVESRRCVVIRTSIVGPEISGGHGLLGWFLRQGGPVNGYTNHRWNGISTLEWARLALEIISGRIALPRPLFQAGVEESVSKFELLRIFQDAWNHQVEIRPTAAPESADRTLIPDVVGPPLVQQLAELAQWHRGTFPPVRERLG